MCLGNIPEYTVRKGAQIRAGTIYCSAVTSIYVINPLPLARQVMVHASCKCNELHSLVYRHLIARGQGFKLDVWKRLVLDVNLNIPEMQPVTYQTVVDGYVGAKKRMYYKAMLEILDGDVDYRRESRIRMFVKPDRYFASDIMDKAPRAIQARAPKYNLALARYLKRFEEWFYNIEVEGVPQIAKGKSNLTRAGILKTQLEMFKNPTVIMLDHSKFDSSVNEYHLRFLHKCYHKAFKSKFLRWLLRFQMYNKCVSKNGIVYRVKATRMSGDFDTALGNTLLNYAMLDTFFKWMGVRVQLLVDGDDSLAVVEKTDLERLNFDVFAQWGFDTKVDVSKGTHDIEFCRARYLDVEPPLFARDPIRALSNMSVALKAYHGTAWLAYLAGLGKCESVSSNGVPIIGPIARKLAKLHHRPIIDNDFRHKLIDASEDIPVTDEARVRFAEVYGMDPEEQLLIESDYQLPAPFCTRLQLMSWYESRDQ